MREIKFRGKRIDNGEWVYGYPIIVSYKAWIKDINDTTTNPRRLAQDFADFRCVEVEKETVGQFTGLHDKNGVEVYEGDIVKWGHLANAREKPIRIAVVEFNPDIQYRTVTMGDTYFKQGCFAYAETQFYEVIGNIHENPELLEVEK